MRQPVRTATETGFVTCRGMQPDDSHQRLWQVFGTDILIEELSDNEFALFNGHVWDSTLLNAIDVCLLQFLVQHPKERILEGRLIGHAGAALGLPVDDALRRYCVQALEQLAEIGLVHR